MISINQLDTVPGKTVYGSDGAKIGKAGQVYLDDASGQPEWVTVHTGLFGSSESFVPLEHADVASDGLHVPYTKDKVKDAPRVDTDGHLDLTEEDALFEYYGLRGGQAAAGQQVPTGQVRAETAGRHAGEGSNAGRRDRSGEAGVVGHDTSGPTTDDAMTRSEETLRVGAQTREAGRARLRKHVVTEQQSVTVPVSHEEVRLEREPITEANAGAAGAGPAISEEEHEVVLHEEVPVVSKEVNAVERVRLGKETVTEQQTVTDEVRKEQVELEGDQPTKATGRRKR